MKYLSVILLSVLLFSCTENKKSINEPIKIEQPKHSYLYNIIVDSLKTETGTVNEGETISDILLKRNISHQIIYNISTEFDSIYDFRKIRAGRKYAFLFNENQKKPLYFIYERNLVDFVVLDFRDSINVYLDYKQIDSIEKSASGMIESSLWNCMMKDSLPPELVLELSEIFAWTVDFFGIQKGDWFKVIYNELHVDGDFVGIGEIKASMFNHYGKEYTGFHFKNDIDGYYDANGKNLKREFLKAPLRFSRISSGFSNSRLHPILKIRRPHHGIDYAAPIGTPILAIGAGTVTYTGYKGGAGRMVKIKHKGSFTSAYLHLSKYGKGICSGAKVQQGQTIGYVGSSGLSTGPHLDFRMYLNGRAVNPLRINSEPLEPLDSNSLVVFKKSIKVFEKQIEEIKIDTTAF